MTEPKITINELIGKRLKVERTRLGLSGAKFGERLKPLLGQAWSRQRVSEAEAGKRDFRVSELIALARAAEVQVYQLVNAEAEHKSRVTTDAGVIGAAELFDLFKEPGAAKGPSFRALAHVNTLLGALETMNIEAPRAYRELRRLHPAFKGGGS
ncbi:MAG TPA: helix-turn-helix transcriptional regulator [Candidatus Dormibacteraeota bacterium]|nr:helix-turn-helix transcriptional regulator [Candidatus Dormibacteraeota bacterium]